MRPAMDPRPAHSRPQPPARVELPPRDEIAQYHLADEARLVAGLVEQASNAEEKSRRIAAMAGDLVRAARANRHKHGGVDAFMHEYGLASEEGVVLMCLAEALLRIPDTNTADALIAEKIGGGRWDAHLGQSDSLFVNASTFGLMLTGRVVRLGEDRRSGPLGILNRLVARSGEPLIRQALRQAMKILGDNFVLGRTIEEALAHAAPLEARGYRFSYDMLGERAKTADRCRALLRALPHGHRGHRQRTPARRWRRPQAAVASERIRQAFRAARALRAGQGRAPARRAAAAACCARRRRPPQRHRAHHRRGGAGSARHHARPCSAPPTCTPSSTAGPVSGSRCRPTASAQCRRCSG